MQGNLSYANSGPYGDHYMPQSQASRHYSQQGTSSVTFAQNMVFLKQSLLLQPKYPQKLTFNFIKQFSCEGQAVSFNELNLRKCLTIRLAKDNPSAISNTEQAVGNDTTKSNSGQSLL